MERKMNGVVLAFLLALIIIMNLIYNDNMKYSFQLLNGIFSETEQQDVETEEKPILVSDVVSNYNDTIFNHSKWIDLNGLFAKTLGIKGLYKSMGMYILEDDYIVSSSGKTTTNYEYDEITKLKQFLDERNIQLLYVNAPTKYLDDRVLNSEFGIIDSYSNQNADLFLQRIAEANIDSLDLRQELIDDGKNIYDMFYKTDHHWTVDSGLWATGKIVEKLNGDFGYHIDTTLYNLDNYKVTKYKNCWLGEQGRKIAKTYVGLDDYARVEPLYPTYLSLQNASGDVKEGDFSIFIDESSYQFDKDVYTVPSMHYSYVRGGINQTKVINRKLENAAERKKILLLADSYSQVVVPFLSLGNYEVDTLVLRGYPNSLREFIDAGDYDTVIILYAQFMIGAHDYENSANYSMFTFE